MKSNSYPEFAANSQVSSQVANWAKNWAETFRREAWEQPVIEIANESFAVDLLNETETKLSSPAL